VGESREIELLLKTIDQAYDHRSWHGTNLRGSIRGLSLERAAWRPAPGRHNVWELVVHAAYWKYAVARRFTGESRGSFPLKGSNWFARPQLVTGKEWKADVQLLDQMHALLRDCIENLPPGELSRTPKGSRVSNEFILTGIAAHDLYHAGQIQLLKKLAKV
jgi:uncharacterized damage-inducible protein DinB